MIRKAFKRNIQKKRQARSIVYMQEKNVILFPYKKQTGEGVKNAVAGFVLGLVFTVGGFYTADHAIEKRNEAIGVKSSFQSK